MILLGVLALTALVVVGVLQAGGGESTPARGTERFDLQQALQRLDGAPAPLERLHERANQIVPADEDSFARVLEGLEGHPVVVNKWASWCGPCRAEFPLFQREATAHGKEVAFVGLNSRDGRPPASRFLKRYPVPYPSYEDPEEELAREIGAPANYPITVFFDASGEKTFVKQGGYRSAEDLRADIERYAR